MTLASIAARCQSRQDQEMDTMPETTTITPTIGRRVWYWPNAYDRHEVDGIAPYSVINQSDQSQACDAGIVYVHGGAEYCMVNLTVADHEGVMHRRTSVRLLQGDDKPYPGEAYATWMPYQKSQSAKADALATEAKQFTN